MTYRSLTRVGGLRGSAVHKIRSWALSLSFYLLLSEQVAGFQAKGLQTKEKYFKEGTSTPRVVFGFPKDLVNSLQHFFLAVC